MCFLNRVVHTLLRLEKETLGQITPVSSANKHASCADNRHAPSYRIFAVHLGYKWRVGLMDLH